MSRRRIRHRTMKRHALTLIFALTAIAGWAVVWMQSQQRPATTRTLSIPPPQSPAEPSSNGTPALFSLFPLDAPGLEGAAIGFCLLGPDGDPIHESPLSRTALAPASALKTVTTATALDLLGPDFRFETQLRSTAKPDAAGTITGNLVLVGAGDPTLTRDQLIAMVDKLAAQGVKSITGGLTIDTSVFPHDPMSEHWNWGDVGNAYGVGAFGVNLNHNVMNIRLKPGRAPGEAASISAHSPTLPDLTWINQLRTGTPGSGDGVIVYSEPYGRRITLRGTIPPGDEFSVRAAFPDPPALADFTLREALKKLGIRLGNAPSNKNSASHILATHRSAPLPAIIRHCHQVSDNLEAQCLFLTVGNTTGKNPVESIRSHWKSKGVNFTAWRLLDGSGLARANMIRPLDLARINHFARKSRHGQIFYESLNASSDGSVRSKLGAMSGVRSDTGFIRKPDGTILTFALIGNGLGPQADFWALRHRLVAEAKQLP